MRIGSPQIAMTAWAGPCPRAGRPANPATSSTARTSAPTLRFIKKLPLSGFLARPDFDAQYRLEPADHRGAVLRSVPESPGKLHQLDRAVGHRQRNRHLARERRGLPDVFVGEVQPEVDALELSGENLWHHPLQRGAARRRGGEHL